MIGWLANAFGACTKVRSIYAGRFKQDTQFKTPRANVYFSITSPVAHSSVDNCVMTELFVKLLEDALNETLYLVSGPSLNSSISLSLYSGTTFPAGSHQLHSWITSLFPSSLFWNLDQGASQRLAHGDVVEPCSTVCRVVLRLHVGHRPPSESVP